MGRRKKQVITDEMMTVAWEDAALAESMEDAGFFVFEGADSYAALRLSGLTGLNWYRLTPDRFRVFLCYGDSDRPLTTILSHQHLTDLAAAMARK